MKCAVAVLAVATVFLVVGCSDDAPTAPASTSETGTKLTGDFTGAGDVPGALSRANSLSPLDIRLKSNTSIAARVTYTSTSGIDDSHTQVTGTVFVPIGTPPKGGWPVLAYAHPDTGSRSGCAPSLSPDLSNSSVLVAALVQAGYAVTMPDYQGLGDDSVDYPYLDSTTAGYNLIDSVRAARRLSPDVSSKWLAIGTGLGGQAAWAANELVANYGGDLELIGAAALSPTANINGFADTAAAGELTTEQKLTLVAYLNALSDEYDLVNLDDFRRGAAEVNWNLLLSCTATDSAARLRTAEGLPTGDLRPVSPEAADVLRGYLQKTSLPLGPTKAPMLVIYGGRDPLIPAAWTAGALEAACRMGDVIDTQFRPDVGQFDASAAFGWVTGRFAGEPTANSCQPAPPEAPPETPAAEPTDGPAEVPEETYEAVPESTAPPSTTTAAATAPASTTAPPTAPATTTTAATTTAAPPTTPATVGPLPGPPAPVLGPPPGPAS